MEGAANQSVSERGWKEASSCRNDSQFVSERGEGGVGGGHPVEMITSVNISYVAGFVNLCNGENLFSE